MSPSCLHMHMNMFVSICSHVHIYIYGNIHISTYTHVKAKNNKIFLFVHGLDYIFFLMFVTQKIENQSTSDPTILLLAIYPKDDPFPKDICSTIYIVALLVITRSWKQPRYSST